jgi:hypothetical protein
MHFLFLTIAFSNALYMVKVRSTNLFCLLAVKALNLEFPDGVRGPSSFLVVAVGGKEPAPLFSFSDLSYIRSSTY